MTTEVSAAARWTGARLDAWRLVADPRLDPIVRGVFEASGPAVIGRITRQLDDWEAPLPADLPAVLRDYFEAPVSFTDWVDHARIRHAEEMFTSFGPMTVTMLLLNGFPHCL